MQSSNNEPVEEKEEEKIDALDKKLEETHINESDTKDEHTEEAPVKSVDDHDKSEAASASSKDDSVVPATGDSDTGSDFEPSGTTQQMLHEISIHYKVSEILVKSLFEMNPHNRAGVAQLSDRDFILNLETEILEFIVRQNVDSWKLTPLNSYYRLLTHKLAEYYNLGHILSNDGYSMVLFKINTSLVNADDETKKTAKFDRDGNIKPLDFRDLTFDKDAKLRQMKLSQLYEKYRKLFGKAPASGSSGKPIGMPGSSSSGRSDNLQIQPVRILKRRQSAPGRHGSSIVTSAASATTSVRRPRDQRSRGHSRERQGESGVYRQQQQQLQRPGLQGVNTQMGPPGMARIPPPYGYFNPYMCGPAPYPYYYIPEQGKSDKNGGNEDTSEKDSKKGGSNDEMKSGDSVRESLGTPTSPAVSPGTPGSPFQFFYPPQMPMAPMGMNDPRQFLVPPMGASMSAPASPVAGMGAFPAYAPPGASWQQPPQQQQPPRSQSQEQRQQQMYRGQKSGRRRGPLRNRGNYGYGGNKYESHRGRHGWHDKRTREDRESREEEEEEEEVDDQKDHRNNTKEA